MNEPETLAIIRAERPLLKLPQGLLVAVIRGLRQHQALDYSGTRKVSDIMVTAKKARLKIHCERLKNGKLRIWRISPKNDRNQFKTHLKRVNAILRLK